MKFSAWIAQGWQGAILLFRRNPAGMQILDCSVEGFWKSFLIPLLLIPLNLVALLPIAEAADADFPGLAITHCMSDVINIILFPVLLVPLTRFLGLSNAYVPFIVANNWAFLPLGLAYGTISFLIVIVNFWGGISAVTSIQIWIGLPLLVISLAYLWTVARIALQTSPSIAAAITAIQYILSLIVERIVELTII